MLTIKSLSLVVATIATLSISAHAAERQPNPLHPAFAKTAFRTEWMTAGAIDGKRYVDERNPLNPAFKR